MAEARLTEQQRAVVEDRGGTLLVSAAAGSGKTKVLVDRVLRRIVEEGKNIHEFLIITFTNAAAAELRGKISAALTKELARQPDNRHLSRQLNLLHLSQISTVHAFCGSLIRQYGYLLEIPADCRLLEESERLELLDRQLEELLDEAYEHGGEQFRCLTDTLGAGRTDQKLVDLVKAMFEKIQSQPYPEKWLRQQEVYMKPGTDLAETVWGRLLMDSARERISWLIARYDWAISVMEGDALLTPKYLPCYRNQRTSLQRMLTALDGPWDGLADAFQMDYPRILVQKYPDPELLEEIKAVKSDGKDLLEELRRLFGRSSAALIAEQARVAPALEALIDLVGQLEKRFSAEKRRKNLLDFSDQEHLAIRLLVHPESSRPTEVAKAVAGRFTEIMVDEYQDSNRVQELIFTAICAPGDTNRFLVGDVKQSIYGFRQAEPGIFLEKYRTYVPADMAREGQCRKLVLSKNFRSRPELLNAVNDVFSVVMSEPVGDMIYGSEERLYPGLDTYPSSSGPHVELHVLETEKASGQEESKYQREAAWVTRRIAQMLRDKTPVRDGDGLRPVQPGDIAILFRARDAMGLYSRALKKAGIPVASGGGEDLFQAPEVKVLVDLLRVLNNPHQDIPLLAVLCSPVFRLSNDQLAAIRSGSREARFYDAMRACDAPWCMAAVRKLEDLRQRADGMSADVLVWTLLHETGILAAYSAMEDGGRRRENLLAVYQLARKAASDGYLYLYQLLRSLDRAARRGNITGTEELDGVVLTTMHRSKGLEYPVVFLVDLSRKFNFQELKEPVLFDSDMGIGAKITDTEQKLRYPGLCYEAVRYKKRRDLRSEELRVLYVAMTRPKDYLIMTYASEYAASALNRLRAGAGNPAEVWAATEAGCLGDWVLLAALSRLEAGALFAVCGRPRAGLMGSDSPWRICYEKLEQVELPQSVWTVQQKAGSETTVPSPAQLLERLAWKDSHRLASMTPSKLTATQLKGRDKDQEAAEGAKVQARLPRLRRPEFILEKQGLSATERGTAVHLFLQYADFARCTDTDGVISELDRLCDEEFLTDQQAAAVVPETVAALFSSEVGRQMLDTRHLIREFKFSILEDASAYYTGVDGEQLLLQGVVDAAILDEDGLTVIDFKTDRVTAASAERRAEEYRGQMEVYRRALERIFQKPVRQLVLYFLEAGKAVAL